MKRKVSRPVWGKGTGDGLQCSNAPISYPTKMDDESSQALPIRAPVEKGLLLDVLGQTAVLTPGQKSKLDNVRREEYPSNFALSLMHKDFSYDRLSFLSRLNQQEQMH